MSATQHAIFNISPLQITSNIPKKISANQKYSKIVERQIAISLERQLRMLILSNCCALQGIVRAKRLSFDFDVFPYVLQVLP